MVHTQHAPAVASNNIFPRRRQSTVLPALPLYTQSMHHHHPPPPPPQVFAPPFYPSNIQPFIPQAQHQPQHILQHPPPPQPYAVMAPPPPAPEPVPEVIPEPAPEPVRESFKPPLPWYSAPGPFPARQRRKRRIEPALPLFETKVKPAPKTPIPTPVSDELTPPTSRPPSEADTTVPTTPSSTRPPSVTAASAPKPAPAVPIAPVAVPHISPKKVEKEKEVKEVEVPKVEVVKKGAAEDVKVDEVVKSGDKEVEAEKSVEKPVETEVEKPVEKPAEKPAAPAAPKAWADLLRKDAKPVAVAAVSKSPTRSNGAYASLEEALKDFHISSAVQAPFLEPRGLVNTGNMCFMNAILQILVYCGPFYYFLEKISTAAKNFKDDTPLIETMIMFMREFRVITRDVKSRIKTEDLEALGQPFAPEHVYETIRKLKRFSHMRRGHQHDAEEFLGFLLDGLHEEAVETMKKNPAPITNGHIEESGWMEVGHKQKAATTRTTEVIESPITKIFGGKLRSEFKVPGLAPSVTLEPYTPLQLDIQAPEVKSVIDALKHITKPEKIQGDFKSPKGPNVTATKQVFIDTVPPVLILHLKRFQYDNTGGAQKIWKQIAYPLELDFPVEAMTRRPGASKPKYRLIGVVYHHGTSASGGHYTVDVLRQDAKSWIRMDDTAIKRVSAQEVVVDLKDVARQNDQDEHTNGWEEVNGNGETNGAPKPPGRRFVGKDNKVAYILFYQRI